MPRAPWQPPCALPSALTCFRLAQVRPDPHPFLAHLTPRRETEELYNAILKNDIRLVYKKIEEGADVNFVFSRAYR